MKCELYERFFALAERVAKLEAASSLPLTVPTVQHSTNVRIATDPTAPAIPDGFALAPGWLAGPSNWRCHFGLPPNSLGYPTCSSMEAPYTMTKTDDYGNVAGACPAHAVAMGALVPLVPAEPSGTRGEAARVVCPSCELSYEADSEPSQCRNCGCWSDDQGSCESGDCNEYKADGSRFCQEHAATAPQPEAPAGLRDQIKAVLERYCDGDWSKNQHMVIRCIENDILQILEPLPAEPPRCGAGRSDCFCAARDENASVWCARCANAWCCADEDDPNAECRVDPPAERPAPEVVRGCRGCRLGYPLDGELHKPIGSYMCPYEWMRCTDTDPSEPAKAPLSEELTERTLRAEHLVFKATIADLEARLTAEGAHAREMERRYAESQARLSKTEDAWDVTLAKLAAAEKERDLARSSCRVKDECLADSFVQADARVAEERARCWRAVDRHVNAIALRRQLDEEINASGAPAPTVKP